MSENLTNDQKTNPLKKFRRNLEALEISKNDNFSPEYINEQKYVQKVEPLIRQQRNLDKLEQSINTDIKEREKEKDKSVYTKSIRSNRHERIYNRPIEKKEEIILNASNIELFPTLGNDTNNQKKTQKLSIWNMKNHSITTVTPDFDIINSQIENSIGKNTSQIISKSLGHNVVHSQSASNNYNFKQYENDSYDSDELVEVINETESDNLEEEEEEDSDIIYITELYGRKIELINNIQFVKKTYNNKNIVHIKFLYQLENELIDIEDKIQKYEYLQDELEKTYGPSFTGKIEYTSLYDDICNKKIKDIEVKKSKTNFEKFVLDLQNTRIVQ